MELLLGLAALLWLGSLASTALDARHDVALAARPPPAGAPPIAIIVPARNEAHQIARCLRSLLAQDWPKLRVVCVDDRSEDATHAEAAALAHDPRLVLVRGEELPAGWLGKNFANAQGVQHAGAAEWLLFTDADTVHAPGALASAYAAAVGSQSALLTLFTQMTLGTFWERAFLPGTLAAIVALFPLRRVNDPRSPTAIANGQFLLVRRADYDALGGHAAIRDRVADDLELARLFKSSGRRIRALDGRAFVSVRMYTSLRELWWGFVKNSSAGAGGPFGALAGAVLVVLTALPFFALPFARGPALGLAALGCVVALAQRAWVLRTLFGQGAIWALCLPFGQLFLAGVAVHSALRQLAGKGPLWKGRAYPHGR